MEEVSNTKINIKIDGETISVPKEIILQSDYLKGMLDYSTDDIELKNVDAKIFKLIMLLLEINKTIPKEKVAQIYDFLGFDNKLDFIKEFYCKQSHCKGISLTKSYCNNHRCLVENCHSVKFTLGNQQYNYCEHHICMEPSCTQPRLNSKYCESHKNAYPICAASGCGYLLKNKKKYCKEHICGIDIGNDILCNNLKVNKIYCIEHACSMIGCTQRRDTIRDGFRIKFKNYCYEHTCPTLISPTETCENSKECNRKYCHDHTCVVSDCGLERSAVNNYKNHCCMHLCQAGNCDNIAKYSKFNGCYLKMCKLHK